MSFVLVISLLRGDKRGKIFPLERRERPTLRNGELDFDLNTGIKIPWDNAEIVTCLFPWTLERASNVLHSPFSLVLDSSVRATRILPLASPETRPSAKLSCRPQMPRHPQNPQHTHTHLHGHTHTHTHTRHGKTINEKKINFEQGFPTL